MSTAKPPNCFRQLMERGYKFHVFISWPNRIQQQGQKIVEQLHDSLMDRFNNYGYGEVFLDRKRLVIGYKWDPEIRKSLCRSGVTVTILIPSYLESDYCLTEWNITEHLQGGRLPQDSSATCFVPILLKEDIQLPEGIKQLVYDCSFGKILSYSKNPKTHSKWNAEVDALVQRIKNVLTLMCQEGVRSPNWEEDEAKALTLGPKDFWSDTTQPVAAPAGTAEQPPATTRRELPPAVAPESLL